MEQIENITKEHIYRAIIKILIEGVPKGRNYRNTAVRYNEKLFPPILIISWANLFANGFVIEPNPDVLNTQMAVAHLEHLGFTVVKI